MSVTSIWTPALEFTVIGTPAAQGSKRHVGRGIMVESSKALKPWRSTVAAEAAAVHRGPPLDGPLRLLVVFMFLRPKSHYGTGRNAGTLKTTAPRWMTSAPDADKLVRAVGDALTQAGVIRDDARFAEIVARKEYGQTAGARIVVGELFVATANAA